MDARKVEVPAPVQEAIGAAQHMTYSTLKKMARKLYGPRTRVWRREGEVIVGVEDLGTRYVYASGPDLLAAFKDMFDLDPGKLPGALGLTEVSADPTNTEVSVDLNSPPPNTEVSAGPNSTPTATSEG